MADDKKNIPEWIQKQRSLRRDIVNWPLAEFKISAMGAYGAKRTDPAHGWCPYKGGRKKDLDPAVEAKLRQQDYPCVHYGVDLSAPEGSKVYAPHDGWILFSGVATTPPFVGYDPGAILIAHHDVQDSMWERGWKWMFGSPLDVFDFPEGQVATRYSLLGHVKPLPLPPSELQKGQPVEPETRPIDVDLTTEERTPIPLPPDFWNSGEPKPNKDHWHTLKDGTVVMMTGADAVKQNDKGTIKRWVSAGDHIGYVSSANHVHWEIRTSPLAGPEGRVDPINVWELGYHMALPAGADPQRPTEPEPAPDAPEPVAQPRAASGGGGVLLLLGAAAFLFSNSKSKQRAGGRRRR